MAALNSFEVILVYFASFVYVPRADVDAIRRFDACKVNSGCSILYSVHVAFAGGQQGLKLRHHVK